MGTLVLLAMSLALSLALPSPAWAQDGGVSANGDAAQRMADPSAAGLEAFLALKRDPAPAALVRDTHYWISNENRLELFFNDVKDVGGVHIGVGTDQNYVLAGWSAPDVMVLVDFDQGVVDLHLVYRALFTTLASPAEFVNAWAKKNKKTTRALLSTFYRDNKRLRRRARWAFGQARWAVERRLTRVMSHMARVQRPTFLDDEAQYARVRKLYVEGRVFTVRGDLTQRRAMASVAKAIKASGLEVGTLYLSNAEQYFKFDAAYRKNIRALPFAKASVVLRTSGLRTLKRVRGTYYHYNAQAGANLQAWFALPRQRRVHSAAQLLRYAETSEVRGYTHLTLPPDEARRAAKRRRLGARTKTKRTKLRRAKLRRATSKRPHGATATHNRTPARTDTP